MGNWFSRDNNFDQQVQAVKEDPHYISNIINPCLALQRIAVTQNDIRAISYISTHPSLEIQLLAVQTNGYSLVYIPNANTEIQRVALLYDMGVLQYVTSLEVIKGIDIKRKDHLGRNWLRYTFNVEFIHCLLNQGLIHNNELALNYHMVYQIVCERKACIVILTLLKKCKFYRFVRLIKSKKFCEWYYAPENRGGKLAKRNILKVIK
jgi:hypothetical protein